jgi:integrase
MPELSDASLRPLGYSPDHPPDLRHLSATRGIEAGVDIPTVSRWLGHNNGGALAKKAYGHLRDNHSAEMEIKVGFAQNQRVRV